MTRKGVGLNVDIQTSMYTSERRELWVERLETRIGGGAGF